MARGGGLSLDMSISADDHALGTTFRQGGVSIGGDHMRLFGEDVPMEVSITQLTFGNRIGQGACSTVNIATHNRTGEKFAVKMFNVYDEKQAQQLYNEILLLTSFQCDALISLKGAFHDEGTIGVILEYMDRGSLEFMCAADVREDSLAAVAYQMLWGLGFLHYERMIHRDIKPGNALMNSQGFVKLSDFGISKELETTTGFSNTAIGSFRYMSPERLLSERYDASGDIWSVGMTLLEIWNKSYPFKVRSPIELSTELQYLDVRRYIRSGSTSLMKFLEEMLQYEPSKRSSCLKLTKNRWFEEQGIRSLEDAHYVLAKWLRDLDRARAQSSIAYSERNRAGGSSTVQGAAPRPPRTLSAAVIKESIDEMSMSMSVTHEEMMVQRANNPFTASGSLSTSSVHNLLNVNPGAAAKSFAARPQSKAIDEEEDYEYEDDFESVEPYREETKYDSRRSRNSPEDYYSSYSSNNNSPYGPGSNDSANSRKYRK